MDCYKRFYWYLFKFEVLQNKGVKWPETCVKEKKDWGGKMTRENDLAENIPSGSSYVEIIIQFNKIIELDYVKKN